jgi:putative hydrolase of the HAD superfamily
VIEVVGKTMRRYKHIFFDLDQTLWDFDRCSAETITELFHQNELSKQLTCDCERIVETFNVVNDRLWGEFSAGKITKDQLRHKRFREVFGNYGTLTDEFIDAFALSYLDKCPKKAHLVPGAKEVLEYLSGKYDLHIITNGFEEVQHQKLHHSGITGYFKEVITSELAGYKKPDKEIFSYALKKVNCHSDSCLMVGDNLEADILGASNSRIDHVFYNPKNVRFFMNVTYEVTNLEDIMKFL